MPFPDRRSARSHSQRYSPTGRYNSARYTRSTPLWPRSYEESPPGPRLEQVMTYRFHVRGIPILRTLPWLKLDVTGQCAAEETASQTPPFRKPTSEDSRPTTAPRHRSNEPKPRAGTVPGSRSNFPKRRVFGRGRSTFNSNGRTIGTHNAWTRDAAINQ